jgi:hypothetical protein
MKTFILKRLVKLNGKIESLYHEFLEVSKNKEAMNVYVENLTSIKKRAMVFYSKREAEAMGVFLDNSLEGGGKTKIEVIS